MSGNRDVLGLLMGGDWVSGEAVARALNVTRAAVWKRMAALRNEGYRIEAVTRKGYRLDPTDDLKPECLDAALTTLWAGRTVRYFDTVDSTNNAARTWALDGAPHGALVLAEVQSGGMGRLNRAWQSPPGGVYMTMVLRPEMPPACAPRLTMLAALAVAGALRARGIEALIKWPNDVLVDGRKLCGILTQMSANMDGVDYVLVGMGVNVNQEGFVGETASVAASMRMLTGMVYDRRAVVAAVMAGIEGRWGDCADPAFPMLKDYTDLCVTLGKDIRVLGSGEPYEAKAVGLTDEGALIVERGGERLILLSGDVSIRNSTQV